MAEQVRLGIIGLGQQGGLYARLITDGRVPHMTVGAICDNDSAKKDLATQDHPEVPFFSDYRDLIASGTVDAIITTVPHYLHPEMGIAALDAGLHALIDKPAGVYTKQANELIGFAATKPNLTFGIMFNQRMNPLYRRLREIVAAGEIGQIRRSNWIITTWWRPQGYYDSSQWRATWGGEGGGVLVNQAPHQLDLWQWICGVPKSVYAKLGYGVGRDIAVENEVTAMVDFGDGATGTFVTSTNDITGTDQFEILGDRGKIVVENSNRAVITRLNAPEAVVSADMTMEDVRRLFKGEVDLSEFSSQEVIDEASRWGQQHADVLENFALNIVDGTELVAPGSDGIHGVRLANAIHLSSWTGREVSIDFDEDEYLDLLNEKIREEDKFPTQ